MIGRAGEFDQIVTNRWGEPSVSLVSATAAWFASWSATAGFAAARSTASGLALVAEAIELVAEAMLLVAAARSRGAAAWFASRSSTAAWFSSTRSGTAWFSGASRRSGTGHFSGTAAWFASRSTARRLVAAAVAESFELVAEAMLLVTAAARSRSTAAWFASRSAAAGFAARRATAMVTAPEMERLSVATSSNNQTNNENDATDHDNS